MSEKGILRERLLTYEYFCVKVEQQSLTSSVIRMELKDFVIKTLGRIESFRVLLKGRCINKGYTFESIKHGRKILILRSPITGLIVEVNFIFKVTYPVLQCCLVSGRPSNIYHKGFRLSVAGF